MSKVKHGDTHAVTFTVRDARNRLVDLTGATVRLLARASDSGVTQVLPASLGPTKGTVVHQLSGTLPVDTYRIEVEITSDGVVTTAPSVGFAILDVMPDLG